MPVIIKLLDLHFQTCVRKSTKNFLAETSHYIAVNYWINNTQIHTQHIQIHTQIQVHREEVRRWI